MARFRPLRHLLHGAIVCTVLGAVASCGSRTGLFGPELSELVDGAVDIPDVRPDRDGRADAPVDAPIDVIEEPLGCVPGTFAFTLATPQLMFVLDRSGSMNWTLTGTTHAPFGQARWNVLEDSLMHVITPFSDEIAMGARFFPAVNATGFEPFACIQDTPARAISPALGNAGKILDVFQSSVPNGGTPTAVALQHAAQDISSSRAVARAMVVATDGAPNCNGALDGATCACTGAGPNDCSSQSGGTNCLDNVRTVQTITDIFANRKIPVYVIGIGVIRGFGSTLDAMAVAGGRPRNTSPRYYPAETPAEMTAAFTAVRDSVAKCSYITPSSPVDPNAITVEINGVSVVRDPTHSDGWDWLDQDFGHLQLFGSACALATPSNVSGTITCDGPEPDQ